MLILPPGHGQIVGSRPVLRRRERRIAGAVAAVVVALLVAVVVAATVGSGAPGGRRCVDATVPGFIGATEFHECGGSARRLCSTLGPDKGLSRYGLHVLAVACRRAGNAVPTGL